MTVRKDRRRILGVIAATGGVALVSTLASMNRQRVPLQTGLLAVLSDPEGAREIGREYLHQVPSETNARQLVSLIVERHPRGFAADVTIDEVREFLNQAARDDFASDRTVELNGWVVSRTEARLCALACLS